MTNGDELQSMTTNGKSTQVTELDVLKEILRWVKFSGMKEVRTILTTVLDDNQKRVAYQLSDGTRGTVEIGKSVGIKSTATVSKLWKQWVKLGLGESISVKGGERFRRSFDLEDFGIEVNSGKANEPTAELPAESIPQEGVPKLEEFQQTSEAKKNE